MKRRDFLKTAAIAGLALSSGAAAQESPAQPAAPYDLVAIMGGEPDAMFRQAIAQLGGMERFVKNGHKVVIKPNMG